MNYINIFKKGCFDRSKNKKTITHTLIKTRGDTHHSLALSFFLFHKKNTK